MPFTILCLLSDYERLCDLSPSDLPNTNDFCRFFAMRKQEEPNFFEERHLKFISLLGKVLALSSVKLGWVGGEGGEGLEFLYTSSLWPDLAATHL